MYEFECNIDESYKDMETDEWGAAYVWLGDIGVEYNFCIDSGENCCAIYKAEIDTETDYLETDTSSFIHYEIDFDKNDWQDKLKSAMCEALEELHNLDTVWITVYKDTIKQHDDDSNLVDIEVTVDFSKQYFDECIKRSDCEWQTYEEFMDNFTADDTENFYEYAVKRNAILDIN